MSLIYQELVKRRTSGQKSLAVLIDPEEAQRDELTKLLELTELAKVDYLLIGGSTVTQEEMENTLQIIKTHSNIPCLIFPGRFSQVNPAADGLLFLSLISGRNPEYLIGQQVSSIPLLRNSDLEIISTGYILSGDNDSSVVKVSQTTPIPYEEVSLTVDTALAGQYLGMKLIYLEAGSGASQAIPPSTISAVSSALDIPLIVGGGIKTPEAAHSALHAGADVIVVGNILEKDPELITTLSKVVLDHKKILA